LLFLLFGRSDLLLPILLLDLRDSLTPLQLVPFYSRQWHNTIIDMNQVEGIDKFIECGPMDPLSKIVKLILPKMEDSQIQSSDTGSAAGTSGTVFRG